MKKIEHSKKAILNPQRVLLPNIINTHFKSHFLLVYFFTNTLYNKSLVQKLVMMLQKNDQYNSKHNHNLADMIIQSPIINLILYMSEMLIQPKSIPSHRDPMFISCSNLVSQSHKNIHKKNSSTHLARTKESSDRNLSQRLTSI